MTYSVKGWKKWAGLALVALILMILANYIQMYLAAKWINDASEDEQAKIDKETAEVKTTQGLV